MKPSEERRIYVAVAETIQTPSQSRYGVMHIDQPPGRQIAQACHVVSKLRFDNCSGDAHPGAFSPMTTIILKVRDSAELKHVLSLLNRKKLKPVVFADTNPSVYGPGEHVTAVAVFASPKQVKFILDYLPTWGSRVDK